MNQPQRQLTIKEGVLLEIDKEMRKRGLTPQTASTDDTRAVHRTVEVAFWNQWTRSSSEMQHRESSYAQAAILSADLWHGQFEKGQVQ